jgi:hypothetical protein
MLPNCCRSGAGEGMSGSLLRGSALATLAELAKCASVERVLEARAAGMSWTAIAKEFGITKQSAHSRFG